MMTVPKPPPREKPGSTPGEMQGKLDGVDCNLFDPVDMMKGLKSNMPHSEF